MDHKELYVFNIGTRKLKKLAIDGVIRNRVIFSPDGREVCYTRTIREKDYYKYNKKDNTLEIYNLETGETNQPSQLDRSRIYY